jgi:hypothetical protein
LKIAEDVKRSIAHVDEHWREQPLLPLLLLVLLLLLLVRLIDQMLYQPTNNVARHVFSALPEEQLQLLTAQRVQP